MKFLCRESLEVSFDMVSSKLKSSEFERINFPVNGMEAYKNNRKNLPVSLNDEEGA